MNWNCVEVLNAVDDAETRATWSRYQVARAVMHKELPRRSRRCLLRWLMKPCRPKSRGPWRSLGRLAVAASVTVAVLAGVRLYNQDEIAGAELAQQTQQPVMSRSTSQRPGCFGRL
jgi:sigma-E factor negative regulatory protein RseA